jgi:hypothetical protein
MLSDRISAPMPMVQQPTVKHKQGNVTLDDFENGGKGSE